MMPTGQGYAQNSYTTSSLTAFRGSWRSVFISSPRFWDRFTFEVLGTETAATISRLEHALALVQLCIERTKDHSFSFSFKAVMCAMEVPQSLYAIQILETLVVHVDRWRAAYFTGDPDKLQESLTKAKGRFGQLRTLQICIPPGVSHRYITSDLFEDAPNLTRVYATEYYRLRWSNVTVLHIKLAPHNVLKFHVELKQMTSLEELVVRARGFSLNHRSNVELPYLKTFSTDHYFPLSLIKAPSLERLYLAFSLRHGTRQVRTFLQGVNHLNTLAFHVTRNVDVATIIDCTPELGHLILAGRFPSLDSLRSLAARSLKKIYVVVRTSNSTPSSVSIIHQVTNIVGSWEKRQFPQLHFLSVYVNNCGEDMTSAVVDLIRLGADKGLEVDIGSRPFQMMVPFGDW